MRNRPVIVFCSVAKREKGKESERVGKGGEGAVMKGKRYRSATVVLCSVAKGEKRVREIKGRGCKERILSRRKTKGRVS